MRLGRIIRWALVPVGALLVTAAVALAVGPSALTIDPKGIVSSDRQSATVSGSVTCPMLDSSNATNRVRVDALVEQLKHHGYIPIGDNRTSSLTCTGAPQAWSVTVSNASSNASFSPGSAIVDARAADNDRSLESARSVTLTKG
jgi:hypothetical protein